jgi:hypothetical protein
VEKEMKNKRTTAVVSLVLAFAALGGKAASDSQDKYDLKVPGGLAFDDFRGYESWQVVSLSHSDASLNVIVANPVMIKAYQDGIPGNGKPWPDGAKAAKIQYTPTKSTEAPFSVAVPDALLDVAFMSKDSKRFADSGGWGYALFNYDRASRKFRVATAADNPPQANDAKCGFACHTVVKSKDYVFTSYGAR